MKQQIATEVTETHDLPSGFGYWSIAFLTVKQEIHFVGVPAGVQLAFVSLFSESFRAFVFVIVQLAFVFALSSYHFAFFMFNFFVDITGFHYAFNQLNRFRRYTNKQADTLNYVHR